MISQMVKGNKYVIMVLSMMDNGNRVNLMDIVKLSLPMDVKFKDNGKMEICMVI